MTKYYMTGHAAKYGLLSRIMVSCVYIQAERARQEALASFGGTDLASVAVKKRDLREELRRDAKLLEKGETSKNRVIRKTR